MPSVDPSRQAVTDLHGAVELVLKSEREGRLGEAESLCRQILERVPDEPVVLHRLGTILLRRGDAAGAVAALEKVGGGLAEAPELTHPLGLAYAAAGQGAAAAETLARAAARCPDNVRVLDDYGKALANIGQSEAAVAAFRRAVAADPKDAAAAADLGRALVDTGKHAEAVEWLGAALKIAPGLGGWAHYAMGRALRGAGRKTDAVAFFEECLRLNPGDVAAANDLSALLLDLDRVNPAAAVIRGAIERAPDRAELHYNYGNVLARQGRLEAAVSSFDRAIERDPEFAMAHFNRGVALLSLGDYARGWPEYEWRWRTPDLAGAARRYETPAWDGADLGGRTILLYAEQGLGDTLQFARYVPWVAGKGGTVVLECHPALHRLFAGMPGLDRTVKSAAREEVAFDVHLPLLSLPRLHGTTAAHMPGPVPYLAADPALAARWRPSFAAADGRFKIGVAWQGNRAHPRDRFRSVPLAALKPALEVPGVAWFSLQVETASTEGIAKDRLPAPIAGPGGKGFADFADSAAALAGLDLVVTVDSAVAHLAGALARPVWMLLPVDADWRWLRDGERSPWYPSMRLFRQRAEGQWDAPVANLCAAIADAVRAGGLTSP